jgi:phenolic acid decarboxylase
MNEQQAETLKLIQDEEKKGNVVFQTFDGAMSCSIADIINQSADGILYDLNRDKVTTITLADTSEVMGMRWINDYAVAVTITALKEEIYRLNSAIIELNNQSK